MTAPAIAQLAAQLKREENDPELVRAFDGAMAWARKTLGFGVADTLAVLDVDNHAAVYGYAGDLLKLPRAVFGMFAPDDIEGLQVIAGDIGKRWAGPLLFGHRTRSSFA